MTAEEMWHIRPHPCFSIGHCRLKKVSIGHCTLHRLKNVLSASSNVLKDEYTWEGLVWHDILVHHELHASRVQRHVGFRNFEKMSIENVLRIVFTFLLPPIKKWRRKVFFSAVNSVRFGKKNSWIWISVKFHWVLSRRISLILPAPHIKCAV